jgi:hypothetical protein
MEQMKKQLIVIGQDGSMSGLDHKTYGVDLKQFGLADVERLTLIEWDSEEAGWFIRWHGKYGHSKWLASDCLDIGKTIKLTPDGVVLFKSYQDAIDVEVATIQQLQKSGSI